MKLETRLLNIEKQLREKDKQPVIRFASDDGTYPEQEEDRMGNRKVIVISSPGVDYETLRGWAK